MPIFDVEANGSRFQIEAPDEAAAVSALAMMGRVKRNVGRMIDQGAPESEIDQYLFSENVTPDQLRASPVKSLSAAYALASLPAPENSLSGSAKALGVGAAEGVIGLAGLPGDLAGIGSRGFDYITGKNTSETVGPYAKKYGSENIKKYVEGYTGEFRKPQTVTEKVLQTTGAFLPAAIGGPAGALGRIATRAIIPGVASEAAGQLTEGTAAEPYARVAGALGGAVAGGRLGAALSKPKTAAVPTVEQLEAAKSSGYKSPVVAALEINPTAVEKFTDTVIAGLKRDRISEKQAGLTYDALNTLRNPEFKTVHTLQDFDSTRKVLNKIAGNFANPTDAEAARRAISSIDAFTLRVPQSAVLAGDARQAGRELFDARKNAAAVFRSRRVTDAIEKAVNTAAATQSGGNLQNEIQKQIRSILNNPKMMRGFDAAEKKALQDVARGGFLSNSARRVGKVFGGGGGLGQMISGGAGGAMFGWPGMVALPALGYGANKAGIALTANRARRLDDLIRSRSPLYGAANQAAYRQALQGGGGTSVEQLLLQSLLARQAAD